MEGLTLESVRERLKPDSAPRVFSLRDFVDKEEVETLHEAHRKRIARKHKTFDDVDSLVAEILGRFGWDVYERWNTGEIDADWMARMLNAERARETAARSEIITSVYQSILGTVAKHPKQRFEAVQKILDSNQKIMKGEI